MYYMPTTDQILGNHSDVRQALPHVLFFSEMDDQTLADFGVFRLLVDEKPFDCAKVFAPAAPVLRDDVWCQPWIERPATEAEVLAAQTAQIDALIKAATARLNAFAATRIYGDEQTSPIVAACSYAASEHEKYGPEGRYCVTVRDATWDAINDLRADVLAGRRAVPATFPEFEIELPQLVWPV